AHLNTLGPSWRRVGHGALATPALSCHEWVWPIAAALEPSEPQIVGPMPGVSDGPTTAAPAPSPRRKEMERSVGSMKSLIFSAPMTRTWRAEPDRTRASAWLIP